MDADIWFPFYVGDYLKDTMQLSAERHGIYLLLMFHCWQNGSIEDDYESICIISKVDKENKSPKYILDKYFKYKDGKYTHSRVTKEKELAKENKIKRVQKAKKAAGIRWNNDATSNATSTKQAMPKQCPSSSSSSSPISTATQSTDNEEGDKPPSRKKFIKPTIFELERYCKEKEYKVDCEAFILHYESNGWLVGKNKMKSWQSALGTWNKNSFNKPEKKDNFKRGGINFEM